LSTAYYCSIFTQIYFPIIVNSQFRLWLFLIGTGLLLVAAIGRLGWEIQTWSGKTPKEKLDKTLFWIFSVSGTFLLIFDYCLGNPSTNLKFGKLNESTANIINSVGLLFDIMGVALLFKFGPIQPDHEIGSSLALEDNTPLSNGQTDKEYREMQEKRKQKYVSWSSIALGLIIIGFLLQLISNFFVESGTIL